MAEVAARPELRAATLFPPTALEVQGTRAGVVSRTAVMVIDAAMVAVLLGATYLGWSALVFLVGRDPFTWPHLPSSGGVSLAYVLCVAYLTTTWSVTGRSVGKRVFGLRVVSRRGARLSVPVAFVRALLCTSFPVLLFWCAFSRENRSVQDVLLRTSVIYDWSSRVPRDPPSGDDPLGVAVDVAPAVAHEADDGESETFAGLDGE
jgi:uncharacterized RDD family membrane protein YckC